MKIMKIMKNEKLKMKDEEGGAVDGGCSGWG